MDTSTFTRRRMLASSAVLSMAAFTGCSTSTTPTNSTSTAKADATPPTYVPLDGVTPDLPGTAEGVAAAFLAFPNPPVARPGFPLPDTEPVTALLQGSPPQTAPDQNPAYQVFRASAGNPMEATTIPSTDYIDKFQVMIAGNDIPDFVQIPMVPQYPKLLERHFTDLTDVLGGDGVKKFPALANIPTSAWQIPVINGRLWGICQPRPPAGAVLSTRGDLLAAKGIDANPEVANGSEFVALLKELTSSKDNRFAMGALPTTFLLGMVLEMMEAPNEWSRDGDTFVSQIASPQMKDALAECGKILKAGYLHPNSFSDPGSNAVWWESGVTLLYRQAFSGWAFRAGPHPEWNVGHVRLPKWGGGGKARVFKSVAGYPDFVAIKKQASDARLEELLRIADFVASPFGTQQFLDVTYGKAGSTYEMTSGGPQYREGQSANRVSGWGYLGSNSVSVLFTPGQPDLTRAQHAYLSDVIPTGAENAAQGLYSETKSSKGASYAKPMADLQRSVMLGERPLSAWDDFVSNWKSEVGDKIAAEFSAALSR